MNKSLLLAVVFVLFSVCSLVYFAPANAQEKTSEKAQSPGGTIETSLSNGTSSLLRDMAQLPVKAGKNGPRVIVRPNAASDGDPQGIVISGIRSSDYNGEEGEGQFVKAEGSGFQIFDKATGNSILGPSDISSIWAGSDGACETGGTGNAVVLYDKDAGRWIFSQFAAASGSNAVTEECFAVSATSDATGSYDRYAFHLGGNFIDSPHLSVRSDGYVMGDSVYNDSGAERVGDQFFVFDRAAMLAGSPAEVKSPGIDTGVGETYSISANGVRISSTADRPAVSTLTINLTFSPDATFTAAGLTAQNIIDMKAASAFAAT